MCSESAGARDGVIKDRKIGNIYQEIPQKEWSGEKDEENNRRDRWSEVVLRALERRKGGWEEGIREKMRMWWRGTPVGNSLPSCVIATCMHTHFLYYTDILLAGANWLLAYLTGGCDTEKTYNIFLYCIHSFFFSPHSHMFLTRNPTQHLTAYTQTHMHQFLHTKAFVNSGSQFPIKSVWPGLSGTNKCYWNTPFYWLSWSPWQPLVRAFDWIWHICLPVSQIPRHQSTISL